MSLKLHIRDKQAAKGEPEILERHTVDAHEIVASDPERFEIVGRVPPSSPGGTTAVLDNDPPHEVARKVLATAGIETPPEDGVSVEVSDEDADGKVTPAGTAKVAANKESKRVVKPIPPKTPPYNDIVPRGGAQATLATTEDTE